MAAYLEMRRIVKRFPGVLALNHVDLDVDRGEIHALLGENGAGKSTLMKILAGAYQKDEGAILIGGQNVEVRSPSHAQEMGISIIYQELNLIPQLSAAENIFLGRLKVNARGRVDWTAMYREAQQMLDKLEVSVDARVPVRELGIAQMQMVEVAKALSLQSKILIMDEPTASLTGKETEMLFSVMRRLKAEGVAIIYISHHLEEVQEIADRATILRDGANVTVADVSKTSIDEMIRHMVGRETQGEISQNPCAAGRGSAARRAPERGQARAGRQFLRARRGDSGHRGPRGRGAHRNCPRRIWHGSG